MFGWRRKTDGFDWKEHVRTTILVRRKMRREKLDLARQLAASKAQGAAKATGRGLMSAVYAIGRGFAALGRRLTSGIAPLFDVVIAVVAATLKAITAPNIAVPLAFAGAAALIAATVDITLNGFKQSAVAPLAIGALLVLFVLPTLEGLFSKGDRDIKVAPFVGAIALIGASAFGAHYWLEAKAPPVTARAEPPRVAAKSTTAPTPQPTTTTSAIAPSFAQQLQSQGLSGRAQAIDGTTLRIDGRVVALVGLESPERAQRCSRADGKSWGCGDAARNELARLTRNGVTTCRLASVRGALDAPAPLVTCSSEGRDLATELVRGGHVFLTRLASAPLVAEESDAKKSKLGLWQGAHETPEAWRQKAWERAKTKTTDGCAIKGQVTALGRTYLMPWANDYEKARVQKARGDRWFCTEAEARAAGWTPQPPG
jgi:endonuclease YncB( thermonuclease family)